VVDPVVLQSQAANLSNLFNFLNPLATSGLGALSAEDQKQVIDVINASRQILNSSTDIATMTVLLTALPPPGYSPVLTPPVTGLISDIESDAHLLTNNIFATMQSMNPVRLANIVRDFEQLFNALEILGTTGSVYAVPIEGCDNMFAGIAGSAVFAHIITLTPEENGAFITDLYVPVIGPVIQSFLQ
jgi:hypothetical protein